MTSIAMVVTNRYDPDPRVHKEATALLKAGYDIKVYAFDRFHEIGKGVEVIDGITVHRFQLEKPIKRGILSTKKGLERFRKFVISELHKNPPLVVHYHDQDTCSIGRYWKNKGALKSGLSRGYFIFDAHDFYWTWLLMPNPRSLWRKFGAFLLKRRDARYAKYSDMLITPTEKRYDNPGFAELYRDLGCNVITVWNSHPKVMQYPELPKNFTVGYVGNIREYRMFKLLIDAITEIPPQKRPALRVAGSGAVSDETTKSLHKAGEELGIDVITSGRYSTDEISDLVSQCTIMYCLYPPERGNIDRAMPVKLFDSVSHGRKVIANDKSLMGDFVKYNNWGWVVEYDNPKKLAEIIMLASDSITDVENFPNIPLWESDSEILTNAYNQLFS